MKGAQKPVSHNLCIDLPNPPIFQDCWQVNTFKKWSAEDAARFAEQHYGAEVAEQFKGIYLSTVLKNWVD